MKHGLDTSFLVAVEVACHKDHEVARTAIDSLRQKGDRFAIAPQVLAEFVHIVTDSRRFSSSVDDRTGTSTSGGLVEFEGSGLGSA